MLVNVETRNNFRHVSFVASPDSCTLLAS